MHRYIIFCMNIRILFRFRAVMHIKSTLQSRIPQQLPTPHLPPRACWRAWPRTRAACLCGTAARSTTCWRAARCSTWRTSTRTSASAPTATSTASAATALRACSSAPSRYRVEVWVVYALKPLYMVWFYWGQSQSIVNKVGIGNNMNVEFNFIILN